jgi:hypothetical protein
MTCAIGMRRAVEASSGVVRRTSTLTSVFTVGVREASGL